jgi:hypothetical protein
MGTKRRLPVSDAEVLAENRAGASQRALAQRYDVSKGAVQKAISRAKASGPQATPEPSAPDSSRAVGNRPTNTLDIRARLEHEALNSADGRSRIAALKELRPLDEREQAERTQGREHRFLGGTIVLEPADRNGERWNFLLRQQGGWRPLGGPPLLPKQAWGLVALGLADLPNVVEAAASQPPPAHVNPNQ